MDNFFSLTDRIKETSRTVGLGNLELDGAVQGFSAFDSFYAEGDSFYYAVTDGTNYEVGSGTFHVDGLSDTIYRHPVRSTNSDELVNFPNGIKEVFVTYAGFSSVYSASGIGGRNTPPQNSGMAFWASDQIIDYSPKVVFESGYGRIGINNPDVLDASITVGGDPSYSLIRASGFADGGSGILFSGVPTLFSGGVQLEPFLRNVADSTTGSDAVLDFGGVVDEIIKFKPQIPMTFFAGPTADCACVDDFPTFRLIEMSDLPAEILAVSGWADYTIARTGVAVSGWADYTMTDRDNAVSGWARYYTNAASGWALYNDTAISGWADYTTTARDNAISGWALQTIINSGVAVSGWARYYVDNQDHSATAVSGWADYNLATSGDVLAISGWADYSDVNVSGWARYYVDAQTAAEANHPYGDSGVRKLNNTYMLDPYNSGTLLRLGLEDDESVMIGMSGGHGASNYTQSTFIGTRIGENSDSSDCMVAIGYRTAINSSGNIRAIAIGCESLNSAQESPRLIGIGNNVAYSGWMLGDGIYFGNQSAKNMFCTASAEGTIGIGRRTFEFASGDLANNIGIGSLACRRVVNVNSGVYVGGATAVDAIDHTRTIAVGPIAANMAYNLSDSVLLGKAAGTESSGVSKSVGIGADALAFASGKFTTGEEYDLFVNNIAIGTRASYSGIQQSGVTAIGFRAAEQASGLHCIYMGPYAGYKRANKNEVIISTINNGLTPSTIDADWRDIETTGTLDIQNAIQGFIRVPEGGNTSLHIGRGLQGADTTDRIGPHNTVSIGTDNADSVALKLWGFDATFTDLGTQSSGLLETRPTLTNRSSMTIINGSGFLCTNDGTGADGGPDGVAIFNKRAGAAGNYLTYGGEEIATENIAGTIIPCRYGYDSGIAISTGSTWMFISGILI